MTVNIQGQMKCTALLTGWLVGWLALRIFLTNSFHFNLKILEHVKHLPISVMCIILDLISKGENNLIDDYKLFYFKTILVAYSRITNQKFASKGFTFWISLSLDIEKVVFIFLTL